MSEPGTIRAGHLIVRQLEAHGVERVYVVPGESFLDVLDGLYDSPIETVVCRQEGGAGFMAVAEGRLTGRPGVVMVTRGPGAANAMIAVHTAWQDGTAMVLFVGLVPVADRGWESFQEFSLEGWFGTTAKRVFVLDDASQAGDVVAAAMHLAQTGRPGPVVVGLPEDVIGEFVAAPVTPARPVASPQPSPEVVARFVTLVAQAERPMLVVGGDGWGPGIGSALATWAEQAHVPIAADFRAYDAVPHQSAAYAGMLGYGGADTLATSFDTADILVFVGCVRSDVLSGGGTRGGGAHTTLVTPDPHATGHLGRLDALILARPEEFVTRLGDAERARGARTSAWMARCAADQRRYATPRPDEGPEVDLGVAFGVIERLLPADRVVTYGAGNATIWGQRYLSHQRAGSLVGARNGAMGMAVPAAVAASLVHPDRHVLAVCGDGDFFMNAQELAVSFAWDTKLVVVVVDNGRYGTIVQHQQSRFPGRTSGTSMTNPDFAAWIRAFGGHGEYVEETAGFEAAFARALASGKPSVVHVRCDPDTLAPASDNHDLSTSAVADVVPDVSGRVGAP